ncbi:pentapeptide repeat-containing protein [Acrocarpospora phusangensis]|uniref:pentapeptide repeat-containing protein n=1 Tax=Acrocarpospora phusangensis TaxID=1070424 RepID=UPI00195210F3|nr:pentapeptide repeat-containing protein [Acrocarpospora phusangensis]
MRRITPRITPLFVALAAALITVLLGLAMAIMLPAGPAESAARPCAVGSGPNLAGKRFTRVEQLPANLRCATLTNAKLDELDLTQRDLSGAVLRGASLKEADLTQAHLEYADLRGADLTAADLGQLRAKQADLRNAILIDAEAGQAEFPHADLRKAVLTRAVLTQATFTNAKLGGADLNQATLGQIKARTADFTGAKLKDVKLGQAALQHAVFKDADLTEAVFTQAELQGADFTGAIIEGASFIQASDLNLTGARGEGTNVPDDAVIAPATETEPPAGDGEPSGGESDTEPARRSSGGLSPAFIVVLVSAFGLSMTLLVWGLTSGRRKRSHATFTMARHAAEEDVTRFGEEIDTLDFEMKVNAVSGPSHDWRAALDAYEAAKRALMLARTPGELHAAAVAVHHGRQALHRVRATMGRAPR